MIHDNSFNPTNSDIFYAEQLSGEQSTKRNNTPENPNSTELSGAHASKNIIFSSVASPDPHIITINSVSKRYGRQDPIIPPSLIAVNLTPNPFNILATVAVAPPTVRECDEKEGPQSPVPTEISSISTPLMANSNEERWETSSDAGTFYSDDEP